MVNTRRQYTLSHSLKSHRFGGGYFHALLLRDFFDLSTDTPPTPEAKYGYIDECTKYSCNKVEEDVADCSVAPRNGKLVHFVDRAIGDTEDDWIESECYVRKGGGMQPLYKARD